MSPISQAQRCKKKKGGEDSFREERGGGGSDGWVGRATGGRYRERQEAGQRDRPTKKEAKQREERGRQSSSVSISLAPSMLCGYMLSSSQIFKLKVLNSVALRSLNDGTTKFTSATQAYHLWALRYLWGMKLQSPTGKKSTPTEPRITEEWSLSRGKLTHTTVIY